MIDVAAGYDERGITIEQVGVDKIYLPIRIRRKIGGFDTVTARALLAVDLHHESRGTHMSRFITILNKWREQPISYDEVGAILSDAREHLEAEVSHLEFCFKYFIPRTAPVSGIESLMDYQVCFRGRRDEEKYRFVLSTQVPVTALWPVQ